MYIIQILLCLFFLFAIVKVALRYRGGELSWRGASFWVLFWIAAEVVVLLPDSTFYFAHLVGIGRGADLVIYVALAGLFFMIFRLMVKIEKMNKDITKLTRKLALEPEIKKARKQESN